MGIPKGDITGMGLIAIDIGNTSINIGYFGNNGLSAKELPTGSPLDAKGYARELRTGPEGRPIEGSPEGIVISSVVPWLTEVFSEAALSEFGIKPLIAGPALTGGLGLGVENPAEIGPDRVAASVGAVELAGAPVFAVTLGTATTVNYVNRDKVLKGGAIMAGIGLMKKAISNGTALLPDVNTEPPPPRSALGTDTEGCIRSGLLFGTAGAVERIMAEIERAEGEEGPVKAILTGGHAASVAPLMERETVVEPGLTLMGLSIIYKKAASEGRKRKEAS